MYLTISWKFLFPTLNMRRFSLTTLRCLNRPKTFPPDNFLPLNLYPTDDQKSEEIQDLHALYKSLSGPSKKDILVNKLGFSEVEAKELLSDFKDTEDSFDFACNVDLLKDSMDMMSIKKENRKLMLCLGRNPLKFAHLLSSFRELEIPLSYKIIKRGNPWKWKQSVKCLQQELILNHNINLPKTIFSSMQAPQHILDTLPVYYEHMTMQELSLELLKIFFRWQFEDSEKYFQKISFYYQYKSITLIFHNIHLLKKCFNFDNKKILSYPKILIGIPSCYEEYVNSKDKILGFDIKKLIISYPTLIRIPFSRLMKTNQLLKYIHGNSRSAHYPAQLLTYSCQEVLTHTEFYIRKTSLTDLRLTPDNLILLAKFSHCLKRLEVYEKEFGPIRLLSESILVWSDKNCILTNVRRRTTYLRVTQFLILFLGLNESRAREVFTETRLFPIPDLTTVKENYVYLFNQGFESELIRESPHVLLYPNKIVKMCEKELVNTKYGPLYYQTKDFDKLLQLLHCKVHRMCLTYGKAF